MFEGEVFVGPAKSLPTIGIYRPPAARRLEAPPREQEVATSENVTCAAACKNEKQRSARRRPDIQVYVPRAKRALIGDMQSQNVDSGNKILACSERRSSMSSQKNSSDSEISGCQTSCTEQLTTRPPEDEDKLSCHEVSNKDTGRSQQVQGRHLSPKKIFNSDETSFPNETLSNGSNSSCVATGDVAQPRVVEDILLQYTYCQSSDSLGSLSCDPLTGLTNCIKTMSETKHNFKNGCENIEQSQVAPASSGSNCVMECCDQEMEQENCDYNSDVLQLSNKVAQQTELRNTLQCLDIRDDMFSIKKNESSDDDNCRKEENRRTRRILRRNFMSDVLIISEAPVQTEQSIINSLYSDENCSKGEESCILEQNTMKSEAVPQEDNCNEIKPSTEITKLNPEDCTWDMMFDDNGECLDPKLMDELTRAVGSVSIEKPQSDYRSYQSKLEMFMSGSGDEFAHVVEIYNFPPEFKTEDLLTVFSAYKNGGFEIKWVDDTHALGVFSSSRVAAEVLSHEHPLVKTRPLSQATHESRAKARRVVEFLQPYRVRPETCAALARRLVTGALGVRLNTSKEEREAERRLLREAREKKRLAARQREAAWEGTFSEHNKTV